MDFDKINSVLEVREFMEEIFIYLNNSTINDSFINDAKNEDELKKKLIQKCKNLLNKIEFIIGSSSLRETDESYLDMSINKVAPSEYIDVKSPSKHDKHCDSPAENVDIDKIESDRFHNYSMVDNNQSYNYDLKYDFNDCPYIGLPAAHLLIKNATKIGYLYRLERRIFFDQTKKYYTGLLGRWLLLYQNCETDLKPTDFLLIDSCYNSHELSYDYKKKDYIFQIITIDSKKYLFQAMNIIEKNEWISTIKSIIKTRKLPTPPTSNRSSNNQEHNDSIYEEPSLYQIQKLNENDITINYNQLNYDVPRPISNQNQIDLIKSKENFATKYHSIKTYLTTQLNQSSMPSNKNQLFLTAPSSANAPTSIRISSPKSSVKTWFLNRISKTSTNDNKLVKNKQVTLMANDDDDNNKVQKVNKMRGDKVNMIINQLEANGQLTLLNRFVPIKINTSEESHNYEAINTSFNENN